LAALRGVAPSHPSSELALTGAESGAAPHKAALQSRGGDGFSPSSRARGLRWMIAATQPENFSSLVAAGLRLF
jgi:hypothetical protein